MDNFVIDFPLYSKVTFRHTSTVGGGKWSEGDIIAHLKCSVCTISKSSDQTDDNEECEESKLIRHRCFFCVIALIFFYYML